jgi:hypothetical protein
MRWIPHAIALVITVPFAIWILVGDTRGVLPTGAWALPLAAAYYLGLRVGREVTKGVLRAREGSTDSWTDRQDGDDK